MSSMLKFGGCSLQPLPNSCRSSAGRVDQNHESPRRGIEAKSGSAVGNAFAVENGARVPSLAFIV